MSQGNGSGAGLVTDSVLGLGMASLSLPVKWGKEWYLSGLCCRDHGFAPLPGQGEASGGSFSLCWPGWQLGRGRGAAYRGVTGSTGLVLSEIGGLPGGRCMVSPGEEGRGSQVLCSDTSLAGTLGQSPKLAARLVEMSLSLSPWEVGLLGLILWTRNTEAWRSGLIA